MAGRVMMKMDGWIANTSLAVLGFPYHAIDDHKLTPFAEFRCRVPTGGATWLDAAFVPGVVLTGLDAGGNASTRTESNGYTSGSHSSSSGCQRHRDVLWRSVLSLCRRHCQKAVKIARTSQPLPPLSKNQERRGKPYVKELSDVLG